MSYTPNNKFYVEAARRRRILKTRISYLESLITNCPAGRIILSKEHGYIRFYHSKEGEHRKYTTDEQLINQLLQKEYAQKTLPPLRKELKLVEKLINNYAEGELTKIFDDIHPAKRAFITQDFREVINDKIKENWLNQEYERKPILIEEPKYESLKGEPTRSKSESNIMNCLDLRNIPYLYECPVYVNGFILHPDFRVLNVRTNEDIYWEHWGSMDKPNYVNDQLDRLKEFKKAGIILGKNLQVTMETGQHVLSIREINDFIDNHLV